MKRITMVLVSIFMLTLKVVSASAETNSIENASSNEFDWNSDGGDNSGREWR